MDSEVNVPKSTCNLKKKTSNHDSEEGKFQTIIFKNVFKGNASY